MKGWPGQVNPDQQLTQNVQKTKTSWNPHKVHGGDLNINFTLGVPWLVYEDSSFMALKTYRWNIICMWQQLIWIWLIECFKLSAHSSSLVGFNQLAPEREREREIKFIGLFEDRGHRGPYSPYKPFNHNLYIGIIIFPHIDNPQSTGYNRDANIQFSKCLIILWYKQKNA